jgi:cupin superfamily acireductone dioxygenase involved in methionine salvage
MPTIANPIAQILGGNISKAPRKLSPFHHYIKYYYNSHIKEEHECRYAVATKRYNDVMDVEREAQQLEVPV